MFQPRAFLISPPALSTLAALVLVVASGLAWGAAESVDYPGWAPTAGGLLFALPVGLVSAYAVRRLAAAIAGEFRIKPPPAALAAAAFCLVFAMSIAYAVTIGDASSYEGTFNSAAGRYEPVFNLESFLIVSAMLGGFFALCLALALKHLSLGAISHAQDQVTGPDPLGALLHR